MPDANPSPSPWRDGTLDALAALRPNVSDLSARAETAVLAPADPGLWPAAWRRQAAARICALNGLDRRADGYLEDAAGATSAGRDAPQAAIPEAAIPEAADAAGRRFVERVAANPRDVTAGDLDDLRAAGVGDADIVRLCELVAFVSYQCRVEIGHALMETQR